MDIPFKADLKGKVCVVTGGTGVLGKYFCEALAACGAKVAVLGRDEKKTSDFTGMLVKKGYTALALKADVLNKKELISSCEKVEKEFGVCNILVNAAGGNHPQGTTTKEYFNDKDLDDKDVKTFFDLDESGIKSVFDLNFMGTVLVSQVFGKNMASKKNGVIINISSMNYFNPLTKIPAYSAAKAAVSNFTKWLSVHFSKVGIRVNAIAPGFFLTEQNRSLLQNGDGSPTERAEKIINMTPMARFGKPEELLGALLWLADSKASGFVTGTIIPVDGGFSAYSGV